MKPNPKNPRKAVDGGIEALAESIAQNPEFFEARPILLSDRTGENVIIGGERRSEAARYLGMEKAPSILFHGLTEEQEDFILLNDNTHSGKWDEDLLKQWPNELLAKWNAPRWVEHTPEDLQKEMQEKGLSTEGKESDENYDAFVDKFQQKLTTDDCYTPPAVYDAIKAWVSEKVHNLDDVKVIRPFFPGGNYEDLAQYPKGCVVVDNPPFSILSKICRFYCERGIQFFLFGPALTLFSAPDMDVTYLITEVQIEYENGARVRTGFITNMVKDLRIWLCPDLREAVEAAQADVDKTKQGFVYPDNIVTAATLGKIVKRGIELRIRKCSCEYIRTSDSAEEQGRALYGCGFIMSDRAAAERAAAERAAAERAVADRAVADRAAADRAAAARAAATRLNISQRERAIIERLNKQDTE